MLDAFVIEKIRREREQRERVRQPLHLPLPMDRPRSDGDKGPMEQRPDRPETDVHDDRDGGAVIVDFTI